MTYSAAIYTNQNKVLKEPSVLEIESDWGKFTHRASEVSDFDINTMTLADKQHDFASKKPTPYEWS